MANSSGSAGEELISASDELASDELMGHPASPILSLFQARGGVSMTTRAFYRWMAVACVLSAFAASMSVHLLQAGNTSVDQIAAEVGYANGVTLRTLI
jgi:hypothetical protein